MKPLHAKVLAVRSRPRELIYAALLAEPGRQWNVRDLAAKLTGVSVEAVTATLHLLLGDRLMDIVPHSRRLTLRLNGEGRLTVEEITRAWSVAQVTGEQTR
ncbi:hypothetical protein F4553_005295 [Allocatelliglobosispora scoriae]|uniref:MarR family transcriptional regulator n=1 Tax=Allocatelliglobosispora scoriae TaxID=643052 RepID=A0A841BWM9_9ACTN|nr:hypothetical protein [Allocatelliglobosispora scoriae]MBB5871916.1 hypothetical protein [Allocatelliglobosispora scoriae]